ncbi:MAG: glycerophosphodiester phosphodiesterase family protein [Eubacteriales bacterium]
MVVLIVIVLISLLYLYLILPRLSKRKEARKLIGWFYAHRGLHDINKGIPENASVAFREAVSSGYGIELDVQLTKDNILVIFHDNTLDRMCGVNGGIGDYTWKELQQFTLLHTKEKIPTLDEVLEIVSGKVPLIVEVKMPGNDMSICKFLDERLRRYEGMYCVESFHPLVPAWYKRNHPEIIRGQLSSALNQESKTKSVLLFMVEHLLTNVLARPDFIAYNHLHKEELSRKICRRLYRCLSVTWTVKSQEQLENAKEDFEIFIFEGFMPE